MTILEQGALVFAVVILGIVLCAALGFVAIHKGSRARGVSALDGWPSTGVRRQARRSQMTLPSMRPLSLIVVSQHRRMSLQHRNDEASVRAILVVRRRHARFGRESRCFGATVTTINASTAPKASQIAKLASQALVGKSPRATWKARPRTARC